MKKKLVILICISAIIWGIYLFKNSATPSNILNDKTIKLYDENICEVKKDTFSVNGFSMEPMIKNGSSVQVQLNYYNCWTNKPKWWDIVVFENPHTLEKVIKKLAVVPGDEIKIDKKTNTIKINGKKLVNSEKQEYIFKEQELKWFEIYMENEKIIENIYFIFGDNIYGSSDSRNFWPITLEWLVWKVDL